MSDLQPRRADWEPAVRESFAKQGIMAHLGAVMTDVRPGHTRIELPYAEHLSQQHGFFHAGVLSTIVDSAGGYAGFSLMAENEGVLTVEFKINLMAPADGERLVATGDVVKAGRTLTVCRGDVFVIKGGVEKHCATMQQTLMCMKGRADVVG
ncbi:MAG: PaaI family thioesterase [Rhodospirillales bacterium]|nr:PaaI family thioesterase [Rhodospirillales bacterium]MCW8861276.1 PaaI family thioesterase [Rhodospirillales bacterium]MCW9003061.1 PaaI family thioesterase [Rhodospirillales bacterium]